VFEPLYAATEMRAAEEAFPGYPDSVGELMERAGEAVAREAMRAFPRARRFAVVCGAGSNGGDGRVAARVLASNGREAVETTEPEGYDVVIDALLGTGFRGSLRPEAAATIRRMNACGAPIVAVDLPSGVDASTGEVDDVAVDAAVTVTFHGRKVGLVVAPGRFHAGRIVVADIGLERRDTVLERATEGLLRLVPQRAPRDSKYTAGVVLVVGGSPGMTGAAVLVATAALRADVGYVTLAVPQASLAIVETLAVEPVKRGFGWEDAMDVLAPDLARCDAVAIGPGLGRSSEARDLVRRLLAETDRPAVVDADALFGLAATAREAPTVLTPHSGELARLIDRDSGWVNAHRLEAAAAAADRYGAVVLLKGADTIVQSPGASAIVCDLAPPSLATAGSGDVLTGVIASFLAKGLEPRLAAAAGAVAHGAAAASVPHQAGLVASDIVAALPAALS